MVSLRTLFSALAFLPLAACAGGCFTVVSVAQPPGAPLSISAGHFPHEVFDAILKRVVNDQGQVDYKALRADRTDLERYLVALNETSPHQAPELFQRREDKLAYWINAYNAMVLYGVTERPAMRSVNDEQKSFFYFTQYRLGQEKWNLYELEKDVIRAEFQEPRVHMALNCASVGCPLLPREAFLPDRLEEQLAREATRFCASPEKVRVAGESVELSAIFDWYGDDFTASGGPLGFCAKWGRSDLEGKEPIFLPYDWALNAQPGRALFDP